MIKVVVSVTGILCATLLRAEYYGSIPPVRMPAIAGCVYEVTTDVIIPESDRTNTWAVGACMFRFWNGDQPVRADETLLPCALQGNPYVAFEFLFPDSVSIDRGKTRWRVQARVPDSATEMSVEIKPWNALSRAQFSSPRIRMNAMRYDEIGPNWPLEKKVRLNPTDNAMRVSGRVEGMRIVGGVMPQVRVGFRPWMSYGKGNVPQTNAVIVCGKDGQFECKLPTQVGAYGGVVSLTSDDKLRLSAVKAYGVFEAVAIPSQKAPLRWSYSVVANDKVSIGVGADIQMAGYSNYRGGIVSVAFRDRAGNLIDSGCLPKSTVFGDYFYLPVSDSGAVMKKDVTVPDGATTMSIEVCRFWNDDPLRLFYFDVKISAQKFAAKVSSNSIANRQLLNDWIGAEDVQKIRCRKDDPHVQVSLCNSIIGAETLAAPSPTNVSFNCSGDYKATVSPLMDWKNNPLGNVTWLQDFGSCYWIPYCGLAAPTSDYYKICKSYWKSFAAHNTYPRESNSYIYTDHGSSARIEAVLLTMYGNSPHDACRARIPSSRNALATDDELFYLLMTQLFVDVNLVEYHLRSEKYKIHNHNLLMARALLLFAQCFEDYAFAVRYRELAVNIIIGHFHQMFEADGFIREQSTRYHHWMVLHFSELYKYFREHALLSNQELLAIKTLMERLYVTDIALASNDKRSVVMGDGAINETVSDCTRVLKGLDIGKIATDSRVCLRQSGLYAFRGERAYFAADISDNPKEHGHRDFGSWFYQSGDVRWVQDLGGPWKYATKECRNFRRSLSHTGVWPICHEQTSGEGYAVRCDDDSELWRLTARSNIYGPDYRHAISFCVRKDVELVVVSNVFDRISHDGEAYMGTVLLGQGVHAECIDESLNIWKLQSGDAVEYLRLHGGPFEAAKVVLVDSSHRMNEMFKVEAIQYQMPAGKRCATAVEIGHSVVVKRSGPVAAR